MKKKCGNPDLELHPVGGAPSSSHIWLFLIKDINTLIDKIVFPSQEPGWTLLHLRMMNDLLC